MKCRALAILLLGAALSSCKQDYDSQVEALASYVKRNQIGSSGEQWIIKHNAFGEDERVGLIFGFMDDGEFCAEVAELYMQRHPGDRYKCRPAN